MCVRECVRACVRACVCVCVLMFLSVVLRHKVSCDVSGQLGSCLWRWFCDCVCACLLACVFVHVSVGQSVTWYKNCTLYRRCTCTEPLPVAPTYVSESAAAEQHCIIPSGRSSSYRQTCLPRVSTVLYRMLTAHLDNCCVFSADGYPVFEYVNRHQDGKSVHCDA